MKNMKKLAIIKVSLIYIFIIFNVSNIKSIFVKTFKGNLKLIFVDEDPFFAEKLFVYGLDSI